MDGSSAARSAETCAAAPDRRQRPRRVGAVNARRSRGFLDPCLICELVGADHVSHHEESEGLESELARTADVLDRNVGLGAMGRDADNAGSPIVRLLKLVNRSDPR